MTTPGAGADVVKPSKRVHNAYRAAMYVPNKAYNKDRSAGNGYDLDGNKHWLQRGELVPFKQFVEERAKEDEDFLAFLESKKLARESSTAFRKRTKMAAKPTMLRTRRRGKKIGAAAIDSGKKKKKR